MTVILAKYDNIKRHLLYNKSTKSNNNIISTHNQGLFFSRKEISGKNLKGNLMSTYFYRDEVASSSVNISKNEKNKKINKN